MTRAHFGSFATVDRCILTLEKGSAELNDTERTSRCNRIQYQIPVYNRHLRAHCRFPILMTDSLKKTVFFSTLLTPGSFTVCIAVY